MYDLDLVRQVNSNFKRELLAMLKFFDEHVLVSKYYQYKLDITHINDDIELVNIAEEFKLSYSSLLQVNSSWFKVKNRENTHIGFYDGIDRKISWSDDDTQPKSEWLYVISFPTGAYMFDVKAGSDDLYLPVLFNEFFNELKSYKPQYTDSANHSLYFNKENAYLIHNDYSDILVKYKAKIPKILMELKEKKLLKELEELRATKPVDWS